MAGQRRRTMTGVEAVVVGVAGVEVDFVVVDFVDFVEKKAPETTASARASKSPTRGRPPP
jgi:hypothetical protein